MEKLEKNTQFKLLSFSKNSQLYLFLIILKRYSSSYSMDKSKRSFYFLGELLVLIMLVTNCSLGSKIQYFNF